MTGAIPEIRPEDAEAQVREGAVLLDVREPEEWANGHAPGAEPLPMGQIVDAIDRVPKDRRIVAVCRSGARSGRVTEFLAAQGYDCVNLAGGMNAWVAAGLPVVTDDGGPGTVA